MLSWQLDNVSLTFVSLLGTAMAETLRPPAFLALIGGLGAGKTQLTRSIAEALGVSPEQISSPTFVLINEYEGRRPIFHLDVYRLNDLSEFLSLGIEEYYQAPGLTIIEWAERVRAAWPEDFLAIELTRQTNDLRLLNFQAAGPSSVSWLEKIQVRYRQLLQSTLT